MASWAWVLDVQCKVLLRWFMNSMRSKKPLLWFSYKWRPSPLVCSQRCFPIEGSGPEIRWMDPMLAFECCCHPPMVLIMRWWIAVIIDLNKYYQETGVNRVIMLWGAIAFFWFKTHNQKIRPTRERLPSKKNVLGKCQINVFFFIIIIKIIIITII